MRMRIRQVKPPPAWLSVRKRRLARVSTKKQTAVRYSEHQESRMRTGQVKPPPARLSVRKRRLAPR
jgi:hypothetical protein